MTTHNRNTCIGAGLRILNAGASATWRTDMQQECRCCGKFVQGWYAYGDNSEFNIHTMCIAKHWGKHAKHVNHSRCKEFKKK